MTIGRYSFFVCWAKLRGMNAVTSSPVRGRVVLVILLLGSLFLGFRVIKPYLNPILLAIILGSLLNPVCGWLRRRLGGRRSLAALLSLLLVVVAILGPLALVGIALVSQGMESVEGIQTWVQAGNLDRLLQQPWAERFASFTNRYFPLVDPQRVDIKALILGASQKLGTLLLAKGGAILSGTGAILGQFLLFLFVLFYVFKDGGEMLTSFRRLFPLRASQETMLLARIRGVSRSAILGAFGTAAAQGLVGGIGLAICGLPALFWGTMMAFASLIPLIGTTLVWAPACVFLAFTGHHRPGRLSRRLVRRRRRLHRQLLAPPAHEGRGRDVDAVDLLRGPGGHPALRSAGARLRPAHLRPVRRAALHLRVGVPRLHRGASEHVTPTPPPRPQASGSRLQIHRPPRKREGRWTSSLEPGSGAQDLEPRLRVGGGLEP